MSAGADRPGGRASGDCVLLRAGHCSEIAGSGPFFPVTRSISTA